MKEPTTKTLELPSGRKAEIVDWAPAWVAMDVRKHNVDGNGEKFLIEALVKSIDGTAENLYAEVRALPIADYKFLDTELAKLMQVSPNS